MSAIFVTASSMEEAKSLSSLLLKERAAVCVNLIPQVISLYVWEGRQAESQEVMMIVKVNSAINDSLI